MSLFWLRNIIISGVFTLAIKGAEIIMENITISWLVAITVGLFCVLILLIVELVLYGKKIYSSPDGNKYGDMTSEHRLELEVIKEENRAQFWRGALIFLFLVSLLSIVTFSN